MKQATLNPQRLWIITLIVILGIAAGYTSALLRMQSAFGTSNACPATCDGKNCVAHGACKDGRCSGDCPGNCPENNNSRQP